MENVVYHGSPDGNIELLKANRSTHQKECIYATDKVVVAFLFMSRGNRDLDTRISSVDGKLELVERRERVLDKLYNRAGYLYEVDGSTFSHYDYLWSMEVISFEKEIKPISKTYYPNILDVIIEEEKCGNIKIYRYPNRPKNMPLDNSDLIEKYMDYENEGLSGSIDKLLEIYPEFTSKVEKYKPFYSLKGEILKCKMCEERFGFTPHPIFFGKQDSKIVQISQAPSNNVHNSGLPFTDMSGKTLKYEWYKISDDAFYNTDNFFIAALAHCYPGKDKNGGDRQPPKCCFDKWIHKELKLIDNEIYIIIGAKAAKVFFPNENYEDLIFKDNYWNGKLTIVLPHPSPLNKKWIKDHPLFLSKRIIEIRDIINKTINN